MRHLLILRHAKSDWYSGAVTDFERPLSERGKSDAPRVGRWLRREGLVPDYVISSTAKRARETALWLAREVSYRDEYVFWEGRLYEANLQTLLDVLAQCPADKKTILLIGHNPGLEQLLMYLARDTVNMPKDGKLLKTATLAHIAMPDDWAELPEGVAHLVTLTRPKQMHER